MKPFVKAASSLPGSGWFPANTPPEVSRSCSASASAATVICGNCSFRAHARFCSLETSSATGLKHWLAELSSRSHYNVVGVALANKLARMAWAVLARGEAYRPPAPG